MADFGQYQYDPLGAGLDALMGGGNPYAPQPDPLAYGLGAGHQVEESAGPVPAAADLIDPNVDMNPDAPQPAPIPPVSDELAGARAVFAAPGQIDLLPLSTPGAAQPAQPAPPAVPGLKMSQPRAPSLGNELGPPAGVDASQDPWAGLHGNELGAPADGQPQHQLDPGRDMFAGLHALEGDTLKSSLHEASPSKFSEQGRYYKADGTLDQDAYNRGMAEFAKRDPYGYARYSADEERERFAHEQNLYLTQLEKNNKQIEENIRIAREARKAADEKSAQVSLEAETLLSADGGYKANRGTMGTIADIAMATIGGLLQGRKNLPNNMGLDIINKKIEQSISSGRALMADKRGVVADMYKRIGDDYAANEAFRVASWGAVKGRLMTEMQKYDPAGTQARQHADMITQIDSQMAQRKQAFYDDMAKRGEHELEFKAKMMKADLDNRNSLADAVLKERKLGIGVPGGGGVSKKDAVTPTTLRAAGFKNIPPDAWFDRPRTDAEFKAWQAASGKDLELAQKGAEFTLDRTMGGGSYDDGKGGTIKGEITNDGKPPAPDGSNVWRIPKDKIVPIDKARQGLYEFVDAAQKLHALVEAEHGANKWSSPDAAANYKKYSAALAAAWAHSHAESLSDEQSQNFARDINIGGDPSSYWSGNVSKRIDDAMGEAKGAFFNYAVGAQYKGTPDKLMSFLPAVRLPPRQDNTDEDIRNAQTTQGIEGHTFARGLAQNATGGVLGGIDVGQIDTDEGLASRMESVGRLAAAAATGNAKAIAGLEAMANGTGRPDIKAAAQGALYKIPKDVFEAYLRSAGR